MPLWLSIPIGAAAVVAGAYLIMGPAIELANVDNPTPIPPRDERGENQAAENPTQS